MQTFANNLEEDLNIMRQKMKDNEVASASYFEKLATRVENWTSKVQEGFDSVTLDVETVKSSMKSVVESTDDAMQMVAKLMGTLLQGHAEMAAEQSNSLAVTTDKFQTRMTDLADTVGSTQEDAVELKKAVVCFPNLHSCFTANINRLFSFQ